jgi:hypothetical protein
VTDASKTNATASQSRASDEPNPDEQAPEKPVRLADGFQETETVLKFVEARGGA